MTEWGIARAPVVPRAPVEVSLPPVLRRHTVHSRLMARLLLACPEDLEVLSAPTDVVLCDDSVLQPDLFVVRRADLRRHRLDRPPLLAVDVTSLAAPPLDLEMTRNRFERAGVPSYWVVDPGTLRLRAWELRDGGYGVAADVAPGEVWHAAHPFLLRLAPGELAD